FPGLEELGDIRERAAAGLRTPHLLAGGVIRSAQPGRATRAGNDNRHGQTPASRRSGVLLGQLEVVEEAVDLFGAWGTLILRECDDVELPAGCDEPEYALALLPVGSFLAERRHGHFHHHFGRWLSGQGGFPFGQLLSPWDGANHQVDYRFLDLCDLVRRDIGWEILHHHRAADVLLLVLALVHSHALLLVRWLHREVALELVLHGRELDPS